MNATGPTRQPVTRLPAAQAGGTFLGFLLGMLFGLAVALGVAVYITKVPLPFMNKVQPRPADDAASGKKDKDWNPNDGLPGRIAKPEGAAPAPASEAPAAAPVAPVAPATPAAPAASSSKAADPLGELAKARAEAKPEAAAPAAALPPSSPPPAAAAPAATSTEPFQYFVQAGAFRTPEDAEQQRAKLSLMGLQARVSERDQAGRMVYRVRLGPFERRDDAEKTRERLGGSGIEAVVVRMQR